MEAYYIILYFISFYYNLYFASYPLHIFRLIPLITMCVIVNVPITSFFCLSKAEIISLLLSTWL